MYAIYDKRPEGSGFRYVYKGRASLFGRISGYIPKMLKTILDAGTSYPYRWHINIENSIAKLGKQESTLIINLKPKTKRPNLSLYEVVDVWGYSGDFWTPIMFYLKGLFIDEKPEKYNEHNFVRYTDEIHDPIFSMTYLSGTVQGGDTIGKWTTPGPSPTNSVLLWPDTFKYFAEEAKKIMGRKV
jgi:hypothetical protein